MTFMTIEEEAVIAAAVREYCYLRRGWDDAPNALAWVLAGETELERTRREIGVRVEVMEQQELLSKRTDEAVGALLTRREQVVTQRTERGYETVGEQFSVRPGVRAFVFGNWVGVEQEHSGYGFKVTHGFDPAVARQFAALLVKLADQAEAAAPFVDAAMAKESA